MASCYHRWKASLIITISIVLAFIAILTALHSPSDDATKPAIPITHQLSLNASRVLRRSGFNIVATLLLITPEIFFSSPNTTIFAIKDSAITNASFPLWLLKHLLQYHTCAFKLSMDDVLKKPQGSCLPTLLPLKNIAITKVDEKERLVEINHVLVSHPDMFLEGNIAVHGVLAPFSSLDSSEDIYQGWDSIQAPICEANSSLLVSNVSDPKNMVEWTRIVHLLSSHGFVSFAIGLNSVLNGILEDYRDLNSVTIFTPPDFEFIAAPSPMLDEVVRFHMLPQRVTYKELDSLPDKQLLKTLLHGQDLEITRGVNITRGLAINGVAIVAPEIFSSKKFIIHGISGALEMAELPITSK